MAGHGINFTTRVDLDSPPPSIPPEAQPRLARLAGRDIEESESEAPTLGSLQTVTLALQTAMAVEKGLTALANLLPGFAAVASQVVPLLKEGVNAALRQQTSVQGSDTEQQGAGISALGGERQPGPQFSA